MQGRRLLRLVGTAAAAALAVGVPASGAVRDLGPGPVAVGVSGGAAPDGCSTAGMHVSYDVEPGPTPLVVGVVIAGVAPACDGRTVVVELAGVRAEAVLTGPVTAVPLDLAVDARGVGGVSVRLAD